MGLILSTLGRSHLGGEAGLEQLIRHLLQNAVEVSELGEDGVGDILGSDLSPHDTLQLSTARLLELGDSSVELWLF